MVNSRAESVDFKLESLKNGFDKKEYKDYCPNNKCNNLPVGGFVYEAIVLPWKVRVSGEIGLYLQNNLITLSQRNGDWGIASRAGGVISGRIKGLKTPSNAWIRIRSVFGEGTVDQKLEQGRGGRPSNFEETRTVEAAPSSVVRASSSKIERDGSFKMVECVLGRSALTIVENNSITYGAFIDVYGGDAPLEIVIK